MEGPAVPVGTRGTSPEAHGLYNRKGDIFDHVKMDYTVGKAWNMFSSRAYVHQYNKHGLLDEDFVDSFVTLEQVIGNYKNL